MATQIFSAAELERLRGFPEVDREQLVRFFTLTPTDEAFVPLPSGPGQPPGRGGQLCTLPWLGFVPDNVSSVPAQAAQRLAERLGIPAAALSSYGARNQTRTDHLVVVVTLLGWRRPLRNIGTKSHAKDASAQQR